MNRPDWHFIVLGLIAGVLSGIFGVGGGFVVVPVLIKMGFPTKQAAATSLAGVIPIAVAALIPYAQKQQVHLAIAGLLCVGGFIGAFVGAWLLPKVSERALQYGFAAILVVAAIRLVQLPSQSLRQLTWTIDVGLALLGFCTGVLSGLLGLGGGFVLVPGLMVLAHMPSALARGTSLAAIVPTAVFGSLKNRRNQLIHAGAALRIGLAGAGVSGIAAKLAVTLNPTFAKLSFAVLLAVLAITMLRSALRFGHPTSEKLVP